MRDCRLDNHCPCGIAIALSSIVRIATCHPPLRQCVATGACRSHLGHHGLSGRPCRSPQISRVEVGRCQAHAHEQNPAVRRPLAATRVPTATRGIDQDADSQAGGDVDQKTKPERRKRRNRPMLSIDGGSCDITASLTSISLGTHHVHLHTTVTRGCLCMKEDLPKQSRELAPLFRTYRGQR